MSTRSARLRPSSFRARASEPLRIAVLTNGTLPLLGGAERTCWDRSRALARMGSVVRLIGPDLSPVADRHPDHRRFVGRIEENFEVVTYPSRRFPLYADNRQPRVPQAFEAIERRLAEFGPDVLVVVEPEGLVFLNCRQIPGVAWARRARIPVVFENHSHGGLLAREHLGAWAQGAVESFLRSVYRYADEAICFSRWNEAALRDLGLSRVNRLAFPAVDLSRYTPARRSRPRVGQPLRVMYAGRFAEEKRLDALVAAVGSLRAAGKRVELHLYGRGPEEPRLRAACDRAKLDPSEVFRGVLRDDALADAYANADVLANPCPVETFGLAALEALHSGTPVLVPAGGGMSDFVRDGLNGRVMPEPTVAAIASALAGFLDRPESLASLAANARESVRAFTLEAVCREQLAILRRLMGATVSA